jgi:hypothetical protein
MTYILKGFLKCFSYILLYLNHQKNIVVNVSTPLYYNQTQMLRTLMRSTLTPTCLLFQFYVVC